MKAVSTFSRVIIEFVVYTAFFIVGSTRLLNEKGGDDAALQGYLTSIRFVSSAM